MPTGLSDLDHALLGLLARKPATGYDIRKVFQSTALGYFSDSPGSIYPALARLTRTGLLRTQAESTGRRRRTLRLTAKGMAALRLWIAEPIEAGKLMRDRGSVTLRLAFISDISPGRLRPFLEEYLEAVMAQIAMLSADEPAVKRNTPRSGHAAFTLGIAIFRSQAAWCRRALREGSL